MNDDEHRPSSRGSAVPTGRLARLGTFGPLAGGVAGGMLAEGARRLAAGERPSVAGMMLTPANATRIADRLSHLRGAGDQKAKRSRLLTRQPRRNPGLNNF